MINISDATRENETQSFPVGSGFWRVLLYLQG